VDSSSRGQSSLLAIVLASLATDELGETQTESKETRRGRPWRSKTSKA